MDSFFYLSYPSSNSRSKAMRLGLLSTIFLFVASSVTAAPADRTVLTCGADPVVDLRVESKMCVCRLVAETCRAVLMLRPLFAQRCARSGDRAF